MQGQNRSNFTNQLVISFWHLDATGIFVKYKHIVRNCTCYSVPIVITHSQPRSHNSGELADAVVHQDHNLGKYMENPFLVRWAESLQPYVCNAPVVDIQTLPGCYGCTPWGTPSLLCRHAVEHHWPHGGAPPPPAQTSRPSWRNHLWGRRMGEARESIIPV